MFWPLVFANCQLSELFLPANGRQPSELHRARSLVFTSPVAGWRVHARRYGRRGATIQTYLRGALRYRPT